MRANPGPPTAPEGQTHRCAPARCGAGLVRRRLPPVAVRCRHAPAHPGRPLARSGRRAPARAWLVLAAVTGTTLGHRLLGPGRHPPQGQHRLRPGARLLAAPGGRRLRCDAAVGQSRSLLALPPLLVAALTEVGTGLHGPDARSTYGSAGDLAHCRGRHGRPAARPTTRSGTRRAAAPACRSPSPWPTRSRPSM